jgi:apolipoprotein N-acyltransferase
MAWVISAVVYLFVSAKSKIRKIHVIFPFIFLILSLGWGAYNVYHTESFPTLRVASITTDLGMEGSLANKSELQANTEQLFKRTEKAASDGAKLIVWNEAAAFIYLEERQAFLEKAKEIAKNNQIELVVAYAVAKELDPLLFENLLTWISPEGKILQTYGKHHPVPGEPSIKDRTKLEIIKREWGNAGGAICYDMDFPHLSLEYARLGADLMVAPSSDWRGIDPYHAWMTRIRAIEGGMSVLRPVRWATSVAYDQYGRIRAAMSAWETNDKIMHATIPIQKVKTLYTFWGDLPILIISIVIFLLIIIGNRIFVSTGKMA